VTTNRQQALPDGTLVESFEIRRILGTGGFGVTYLGFDKSLERDVAIKEYFPQGIAVRKAGDTTLGPNSSDTEEPFQYGLTRFLDEARVLARFSHPSVVRVHRFLEANGTGYLIMDFEEGRSLWQVLRLKESLEERQMRAILLPILDGLKLVHSQKFLHRDIKPDNIFLREAGAPVLLDFGAARLALEQQAGALTVMLTPGYAPIEQYSSTDQLGPWTDLYALGATSYHCMTGKAPLSATERVAALHSNAADPVPLALDGLRGRYSDAFVDAVRWMLEPSASARPPSTEALLETLGDADAMPATVDVDGIPTQLAPSARGSGPSTGGGADFAGTPELVTALESALEKCAGKVAHRVVRPAVAGAARYEDLVRHLSGFILDENKQTAFVEHAQDLPATLELAPPDTQPEASQGTEAPPDTRSLREEVVRHAERALANFVGPIAGILVEQAATQTSDRDEFYRLLAEELDDPAERAQFLGSLE
jgi:serine/threonine protein kinase